MSLVSIIAGVIGAGIIGAVLAVWLAPYLHRKVVLVVLLGVGVGFLVVQWAADALISEKTTTVSVPSTQPADGRDVVQNLSLAITNPQIPRDGSVAAEIEVSGGTPGFGLDLEIASPSYVDGGGCTKIEPPITDKCNLIVSGGGGFDRDGLFTMKFPDPTEMVLNSGLYRVAIRDQHTGAVVESEIAVN